ncbi:hypothetical protein SPSYN_00908 [Sporotomaculum syntrophicum]|uniref:Uncharacterized protein n=1 Tax=Sporotomaculum syntrophicum TaxID=182264 RepID=A0A9D2WT62_9FIRM|nr:hypothetical protein [Sporotomaculum syntrophicum]KAF1086167.1 hypothetical protein SPSYN_00908 [Sporotomaculum syntrophicum]
MLPVVEIDELLQQWALNNSPIIDFTVNNVLIAIGLDRSFYYETFNYLISKSPYYLTPYKILFCPNNHKGETFPLNEYIDQEEFFTCHNCGEEYQADPDRTFVAFRFNEDYRQQLKKKIGQVA